jgi:hypothetical protein
MNNNKFVRGLSAIMVVLMIFSVGLLAGCTAKESSKNADINESGDKENAIKQEAVQDKVAIDFNTLLGSNPKAGAVVAFIDENISKVSKENASMMLVKLEDIQKKELPDLEARYNSLKAVQTEIQTIYKPDFDLNKLDGIKDQELKNLLAETRDTGYKIETAEGMVFPVINYEFYKKYSTYVTEDIKDYIEIMAVESNKTPAKDAALIIGWDEIVNRALAQEKFIKNYPGTARINEMNQLQKRYITFMLFGANNTPLFSYDTKIMNPEAQAAYSDAIKNNKGSDLIKMLDEYMNILNKTGYKFSDEADKFRKNITEKM